MVKLLQSYDNESDNNRYDAEETMASAIMELEESEYHNYIQFVAFFAGLFGLAAFCWWMFGSIGEAVRHYYGIG